MATGQILTGQEVDALLAGSDWGKLKPMAETGNWAGILALMDTKTEWGRLAWRASKVPLVICAALSSGIRFTSSRSLVILVALKSGISVVDHGHSVVLSLLL